MTITFEDFQKLDVRVGTIAAAEPAPGARRPAYKLTVDFGGELGRLTSSAQIAANYSAAALPGQQVLAVVNFPPKQVGKVRSECLVLGVPDAAGEVVLVQPERAVPDGGRLY